MTATAARWVLLATVLVPAPPEPRPDRYGRAFLGVQIGQSPDNRLVVSSVVPRTAAARWGIVAGDVLVKVGELEARNQQEVIDHIGGHRPGSKLVIELTRDGKPMRLNVRLGSRPREPGAEE